MPNIQNNFVSTENTPTDTIVMWAGTINTIPSGWALCDGLDGRPNLLDKFVRGINTPTTEPGLTGGEAVVTLTIATIPSHSHPISETDHAHQNVRGGTQTAGGGLFIGTDSLSQSIQTEPSTIGLGANTGISGGGSSHNNLPPFFEIAYIIKL